jgi:hypothetical protein
MTAQQFTEDHGFKCLAEHKTAQWRPGVLFGSSFSLRPRTSSRKPYQSRLKWRAPDGSEQSKLLITDSFRPQLVSL